MVPARSRKAGSSVHLYMAFWNKRFIVFDCSFQVLFCESCVDVLSELSVFVSSEELLVAVSFCESSAELLDEVSVDELSVEVLLLRSCESPVDVLVVPDSSLLSDVSPDEVPEASLEEAEEEELPEAG